MIRRRWAAGTALVVLVPLVTGCGLLRGVNNGKLGASTSLTVTSPVFSADEALSQMYTCYGRGQSPPLQWSGATSGAKSFAIVVDDSGAPIRPYVYWLVYHISPTTVAIGQSRLPTGARTAQNSAGKASYNRYDPPCPQRPFRQYRFTVYALNSVIQLPNGSGLRVVWSAIASHVIAAGRLTAKAYPPSG